MIAGKVWGTTELVERNGVLEFHRIVTTKGGVCSKHLHEYKWNGFFVEKGKLLIRVWQKDYDLCDETILMNYIGRNFLKKISVETLWDLSKNN